MSQLENPSQNPKIHTIPVVAASGPPKVTSTKATEPGEPALTEEMMRGILQEGFSEPTQDSEEGAEHNGRGSEIAQIPVQTTTILRSMGAKMSENHITHDTRPITGRGSGKSNEEIPTAIQKVRQKKGILIFHDSACDYPDLPTKVPEYTKGYPCQFVDMTECDFPWPWWPPEPSMSNLGEGESATLLQILSILADMTLLQPFKEEGFILPESVKERGTDECTKFYKAAEDKRSYAVKLWDTAHEWLLSHPITDSEAQLPEDGDRDTKILEEELKHFLIDKGLSWQNWLKH